MSASLLIVEDDAGLRGSLEQFFRREGHDARAAGSVAEARAALAARNVDLILLDLHLPDGSGFDVLRHARELDPEIVVVVLTAFPAVKTAVEAMQAGARDFLVKPFELTELRLTVARALEERRLEWRVRHLEREQRLRDDRSGILGESAVIAALRDQIRQVAAADTPVLVVGETGTGKELVADSVHQASPRAAGPLIKANCSAFSEALLESELFGHEKGAFTDARDARAGLFEMAHGGTLFLDEVSELRPGLQAKLLRVVEGQPFRRVGGQREIHTDVRVVAATNRDLPAAIRAQAFREDLYFRLNVFEIRVPPLRERGDDIVRLARHFLRRSAAALRRGSLRLSDEAEALLPAYDWPGNVRELRNVMERATILCRGEAIGVEHLPADLQAATFVRRHGAAPVGELPPLAEIERRYIQHVVDACEGNLTAAARALGIARNTLKARLRDREPVGPHRPVEN